MTAPSGSGWCEMSEDSIVAIVVALITAFSVILGGMIKMMVDMRAMKTGIHETRNQVQNDHTTGLRDDLDGKHAQQMQALRSMSKKLKKSDRRQWKAIDKQRAQLDVLIKKK